MKKICHLVFWVLALISSSVFARASVPIVEHKDIPVHTASGKTLTVDQIKKAIKDAGHTREWNFLEQADGTMIGVLDVRNKHTIRVDIKVTPTAYSVIYKDSKNMNYKLDKDGKPVIHPKYNAWVENLIADVNKEFYKL